MGDYHEDPTAAREATIRRWYCEVGEDEMLRQIYGMVRDAEPPPPGLRNGNFVDSFNIDLICCVAALADDNGTCVGLKSLALSCKKYNSMSQDMWYEVIKGRAARNQRWVWQP